jgi:Polyketide cyclase / dehydrase and lipid transport
MKFSHTLKTAASPAQIWAIWTDVEHWSQWDTELKDARLEGAFGLGAVGKLTPKTGQVASFEISQFTLGESYTFTLQLPLCKLNVYRYLHSRWHSLSLGESNDTSFTHEVSFQGLLSPVFGLLLGRQFQTVLPSVMENIKQIAETKGK